MKNLRTTLTAIFTLFFLSSGIAQLEGEEVLMTIGDEDVTVDEFLYVYKKNNPSADSIDRDDMMEYLDLYINFRLKVMEAKEMKLDTSEKFKKELAGYRKQLAEPYFRDEELEEKLIKEAYARKLEDIRAKHILITVDKNAPPEDTLAAYEKIMDLRSRVMNGEDFGELAAEYSDDPSARDMEAKGGRPARKGNKGDLGYFTVFDMVYPFETGAYNTEVGEVSMPIRTDYGYHIIYVTDRQPALGQVQVAHIYVAKPKEESEEAEAKAKAKIDSAYQRLQSGQEWDEVVKEFSEDQGSVNTGGKLPWFGANRMVPDFIVAVRKLKEPGDISEPIKTSFGWHIIKLLETSPVGSFEDEELGIRNRLVKDRRYELTEEVILNKIKKENGFKEFPEAKEALLDVFDSTLLQGNWDPEKAAGMDKPVFTLGGRDYTQYDFAKYLSKKQKRRIDNERFFLNEQYDNYVEESCIAFEDSRLEEEYPEFRMLVKEYYDGILLFDLTDQKVWSKAVQDTTGLQEFYNANKNNYMWGKRLHAILYTVNDPDMVPTSVLKEKVNSGMTTDEIIAFFNTGDKQVITVDSGKFSKGDNHIVDVIRWKKGFAGPVVLDNQNGYAKVIEVLDPEPKTIDEARGLITADYQNFLEKAWIKELRSKYEVNVNDSILEQIR
jgi:peptidyl-prolyl cis-trans isomerase SurA